MRLGDAGRFRSARPSVDDGLGAPPAQREVIGRSAVGIGVAFDAHVPRRIVA